MYNLTLNEKNMVMTYKMKHLYGTKIEKSKDDESTSI